MALWDKLKTELDRAGRAAQTAIDEGKVRLEVMRVRQLADKTAEALGYAVFHARRDGQELDADSYARLSSTLAAHEAEVARLESQLARAAAGGGARAGDAADGSGTAHAAPAADAAAPATPPHAPDTARTTTHVDPAMGDDPEGSATPGY